ncbi:MAG: DUF3520 domain-containing protein [Leptospiraceae bacterium]|nr:DUF3520 domain-containing protein [Leptospiraceae bacterium]
MLKVSIKSNHHLCFIISFFLLSAGCNKDLRNISLFSTKLNQTDLGFLELDQKKSIPLNLMKTNFDHFIDLKNSIQTNSKIEKLQTEDLINTFPYEFSESDQMKLYAETAVCPWNHKNKLLMIGVSSGFPKNDTDEGSKEIVVLLDNSGSTNGLPLQKAKKELIEYITKDLRPIDKISIILFNDRPELIWNSTTESNIATIVTKIQKINSYGGTNVLPAVKLGLKILENSKMKKNLVLLTDGDLGGLNPDEFKEMFATKKISFSILDSVGGKEFLDDIMKSFISNKIIQYQLIDESRTGIIDSILKERTITLSTNVTSELVLDPNIVSRYRYVGLETGNKVDKVLPITIGDRFTYVSLIEIETQSENEIELGEVTLNYSKQGRTLKLNEKIKNSTKNYYYASKDFQFASGVAVFSMLVNDSRSLGDSDYYLAYHLVQNSLDFDKNHFRKDFFRVLQDYRTHLKKNIR